MTQNIPDDLRDVNPSTFISSIRELVRQSDISSELAVKVGLSLEDIPEEKRTYQICLDAVKGNIRELLNVPEKFLTDEMFIASNLEENVSLSLKSLHSLGIFYLIQDRAFGETFLANMHSDSYMSALQTQIIKICYKRMDKYLDLHTYLKPCSVCSSLTRSSYLATRRRICLRCLNPKVLKHSVTEDVVLFE